MTIATAMTQLAAGFASGIVVGVAVFSHPFSRAVVIGLIAGAMLGIMIADGVEGYVKWASDLPAEMAGFAAFWIGLVAGIIGGARVWSIRRIL